jgi:hypothetical protein
MEIQVEFLVYCYAANGGQDHPVGHNKESPLIENRREKTRTPFSFFVF